MAHASLQLNQLLGDGALLNALKKGGLKKGDGLLGDGAALPADIFQKLLSGIVKTSKGTGVETILSASSTATVSTKKSGIDINKILEDLHLPADLVEALKSLSPDDLKTLSPETAALLARHMTAEGKLDDNVVGILDALSANTSSDGTAPELYTLVDDPQLAAFLAGLIARVNTMQKAAVTIDGTADKPAASFAALLSATSTAGSVAADATVTDTDAKLLPATTITLADLSADEFQAFKKLAFADIAPYLTMPRTVSASGNNVMKIAQGPAFLNDGMSSAAILSKLAALAPSVPAATTTSAVNVLPQTLLVDSETATPIFLDASVLAKAATAMQGVKDVATQAPAQPHIFNRGQLFAALLGLPAENAATGTTPTSTASATAPTADAVENPQTPLIQAANAVKAALSQNPATQPAAAIMTAQAAVPQAQGFSALLKGLDTSTMDMDADGLSLSGFDAALRVHADQSTPLNSTTSLIAARSASQAHPATFLVTMAMQRGLEGAALGTERQFTIHLDPANLGRVKITLEFGENNTVKAKLLAERPETLSLLQKDASILERALQNSGLDARADSLSFGLGDNGSFEGAMSQNGGGSQGQGNQGSDDDGTDIATIETVMAVFVDPATGLTHVNIVI